MTWMFVNLLKTTLLQYGPFISSKMEANGYTSTDEAEQHFS